MLRCIARWRNVKILEKKFKKLNSLNTLNSLKKFIIFFNKPNNFHRSISLTNLFSIRKQRSLKKSNQEIIFIRKINLQHIQCDLLILAQKKFLKLTMIHVRIYFAVVCLFGDYLFKSNESKYFVEMNFFVLEQDTRYA